MTQHRPDIFDIESDELDRMLMAFAPDPDPELDDGLIDDQPFDDLLDEIRRGFRGGDDGDAPC